MHRLMDQRLFDRVHREASRLNRTDAQNEAGASNLAAFRASRVGSPRLRHGAHAFLKTGKIPVGLPFGAAIAEHVEGILADMIKELGITEAQLSADRWGILNDQRRCLVASGLMTAFLYRGGLLNEEEQALLTRLDHRARQNFLRWRNDRRIDAIFAEINWFLHDHATRSPEKKPVN